jgi:hypothetical protein
MRRRRFVETMMVGGLGLAAGCAESRTAELDAGAPPTDARPPGHDATLVAIDGSVTDAASAMFAVAAGFTIMLNDTSCSGHDHDCWVEPTAWADDTPVTFNGPGSHMVAFRPSELVRLAAGEVLPFATSGPGPGHGHCGLAWRTELMPASRTRVDQCTTATPAGMTPGVCTMHPRA